MHSPTHSTAQPVIPQNLLLMAYRSGIFPMADAVDDPDIFWVEPKERAVIPLDGFHCSRSLRKVLRQDRFHVTCNTAFADVVAHCAAMRDDNHGSWISHRIAASYTALHHAGHAHSVECWQDNRLVGGLYGVNFDQVFCGESMFSLSDNASKVALAWLVAIMRRAGMRLLDCQFMTDHLASMGAVSMEQEHYLQLVAKASGKPCLSIPQAYSSLLEPFTARKAADQREEADDVSGASSPGKCIAQSLIHTS